MRFLRWGFATACVVAMSGVGQAVPLYTSGLEAGLNWTIVANEDTSIDFGYDYSEMGIPPAPGGSDTLGLRMAANIQLPAASARIAASPNGVSLSGKYQVKFDFWVNYTAAGSTEFIGGFVGFDPNSNNPLSGVGLLGDSDGDSGSDYRFYSGGTQQSALNNTDPIVASLMGGSTPALQLDATVFNPPNDNLTPPAGALGFKWHTMVINGDADAGSATFLIDGVQVGTQTGTTGGRVSLVYADLFSSVAGNAPFAFGLFDNLEINQIPEPSSLALGSFAALAIAALRRRNG